MKPLTATSTILAAIALYATSASAASLGLNNASGSATWTDGDDTNITGTPFGTWALTSAGAGGFGIANSTTLSGDPGADINSSLKSFQLFASAGSTNTADAALNLSSGLLGGQSMSFDIAANFRNGFKGVDVRNAADANLFNFNIGGDDYVVNGAASGNGSIGDSFSTNTAFNLSFTQTDASGGTWTITRSGGVADSDSGTYTGVVSSLKLYIGDTDNANSENQLFANNFSVVPEPSSSALLGLAGISLLLRRSRNA